MAEIAGRLFVYGGRGALGSTCVKFFKARNWWVGSIDLASNEDADGNVVLNSEAPWIQQEQQVQQGVTDLLHGNKLDAIICVAGGWAGGNAASKDLVKNTELMYKQSVWSSVIAAGMAAKHLREGGLLTLTGAAPALKGTPGMIGYGLAKAAVHQLTRSLGEAKSGLPADARALAILPITLDTPMNRKFMPKADTSTWTPLDFVADLLFKWASRKETAPTSGSLVQLKTTSGNTELVIE